MSKHTPGPWRIVGPRSDNSLPCVTNTIVTDWEDGGACVCQLSFFDFRNEENEANARLISAAPDLLDALKMLLSYTRACEDLLNASPAGQIDLAKAAILKAEGETE